MTPWAIPSFVAVTLLLWLNLYVIARRPPSPMSPSLPLALFAPLLFATGDLLTFFVTDPGLSWAPVAVLYTGILFVPPTWLLLAHRFAEAHGHPFAWGRSPWVHTPFALAGLIWLGMVTNPWHGQFVTQVIGDRNAYHWLWWIHATTGYTLILSAVALYAVLAFRVGSLSARLRIYSMLLGSAINVVGNLLYVLPPEPIPFDPTAAGFSISGLLFLVGIYRIGLFSLGPVATATILCHQPYGILVTDPDGRFLYWNPAAEKVLGTSTLAVDTRIYTWLGERLIDPDGPSRPVGAETLRQTFEGQEASSLGQLYRLEADGERRWLRIRAAAIPSARGRVVGRSLQIEDHTERYQEEIERGRLREKMTQAQRLESLGFLAGGIAHDFNNLLTAIIGDADFLRESLSETDPRRANVDEIRQAGDRAASLTRQLLAFSRQQVFESRVLDLNDLVVNLANILRRLIGENFDLQLSLGQEVGNLRADPVRIDQVIMNLVLNARDAMPEGGRITIETARVDIETEQPSEGVALDPGSYVVVKVSDHGCGMDEATQAHVFDPFFTTKQGEKGTGLGLATAYGIVKQSGGHIDLESEPGRNSTFIVHLPRVSEAAEPAEEATGGETSPGGAETVLLVEDEEGVRRTAHRALIQSGYTVLEEGDGVAASRRAEDHDGPIHLLVTDVVMPRMGGPELAERLMAARPDLKVLLISGYAENLSARSVVAGRTAAFLPKPFTRTALQRKVREVLDAE